MDSININNIFKAYYKHKEKKEAVKAWGNLKVCTKCEMMFRGINKVTCKHENKNIMLVIKGNCIKKKF